MTEWNQWVLLGSLVLAACPAALRADVVIGDWENGSTDGWIDWGSGQGPVSAPKYTFATDVGVTRGTSSLHLDQAGWNQSLSVKLQDIGHKADFFTNTKFQIDITLPATTTSGWSQIYQFVINAENYGFVDQGSNPVTDAQWGWGATGGPAQTHTLTFDYSNLVDGDTSNGEISPSAGWVEFIMATNNDGTHTSFYFDNARLTGAGDANGDGKVDADDYALIDRGFARHLTGRANGDFNVDGVIDQNDYLVIDSAFGQAHGLSPELLAQRQGEFGDAYVAGLIAAVPEPTSLSLLAIGAMSVAARRRRA